MADSKVTPTLLDELKQISTYGDPVRKSYMTTLATKYLKLLIAACKNAASRRLNMASINFDDDVDEFGVRLILTILDCDPTLKGITLLWNKYYTKDNDPTSFVYNITASW